MFLLSLLSLIPLGRSSSLRTFELQLSDDAQGCGVVMLLSPPSDLIFAMVLISFSTLVNIILALLIIIRLVRHQRYIWKVLKAEH